MAALKLFKKEHTFSCHLFWDKVIIIILQYASLLEILRENISKPEYSGGPPSAASETSFVVGPMVVRFTAAHNVKPPSARQRNAIRYRANGGPLHSQHTVSGHHRPASETPFEWRFARGPMAARF